MQILHPFRGSLQQYLEEISDPNRYRPEGCPQIVVSDLRADSISKQNRSLQRQTRPLILVINLQNIE